MPPLTCRVRGDSDMVLWPSRYPQSGQELFDINSLSTFISDCPTFLVKGSEIMLGGCQEKGSTWTSGRGGGARTPLGDRRRAFYGFTMSP